MQVTGMLHGAKLLRFAGFPTSEVLGPAASEGEIKDLIAQYGSVFVKPVFKGGVRWNCLNLPNDLFAVDYSDFEQESNQLRTHQGQSDVYVINSAGRILAPTFGGGANSMVTEMLGNNAIIFSDFGGNPPYEKMREAARICFKHWLKQTMFISGGKSNNTDIFGTFRAMAEALREYFSRNGPTPLHVVIGRGGPNLVRGMGAMRDTLEALGVPYHIFGFPRRHVAASADLIQHVQSAAFPRDEQTRIKAVLDDLSLLKQYPATPEDRENDL